MKILAVDNDNDTGITLQALMSDQQDMTIDLSFSGQEAMDRLLSDNGYDLVILDIMMPDLSGMDIAKMMNANEKTKNIPVLIMSSALPLPPEEFMSTVKRAGDVPMIKGAIEKPFVVSDVLAAIRNAVRHGV